ncbi:plasmid segregation centromere-binding protein ParR [Scytonema sp. NUACC26]|uniref:plasmid segregation centromere-binding protein ParR n=1 Tax=Scytonema sp. NUACC26 TaxID=3140176 RepID=UPI0034DC6A9C
MFQWSKKVVKSVTFNPGVADESLLALVESQLEKDPEKTFSDLCKEALWQSLCVPESVRPTPKPVVTAPPTPTPTPVPIALPAAPTAIQAATPLGVETQIAEMQSQIANLEERFFAKESHRLETMERHLTQLSQQVAQLALMINQVSTAQPITQAAPIVEVVNHTPPPTNAAVPSAPLEEVDPVISRLSQFLDDF